MLGYLIKDFLQNLRVNPAKFKIINAQRFLSLNKSLSIMAYGKTKVKDNLSKKIAYL